MDDGLKQRLVGALVLLALGVLFVPLLFEPEHRRIVDHTTQIPPAPGIQPLEVSEPARNAAIESLKSAEEMYRIIAEEPPQKPLPEAVVTPTEALPPATKTAKTSSATASNEQPPLVAKQPEPDRNILDQRGLPGAWLVQVASFTQQERAIALRDKLLQDDFPAFTRTLETSKGTVTRVYVGPKINREKAVGLKAILDKSLKIDSLIVRFSP